MSLDIQDLMQSCAEPICIGMMDQMSHAIEIMTENGFSQLPVVGEGKRYQGMITYESIVDALNNFDVTVQSLHVADAMVRPKTFKPEGDLFEMLDTLRDTYAVLIVDSAQVLQAIVTSYDTIRYLRHRAEDMMLVEDIESTLREHIESAFTDPATSQIDQPRISDTIQGITDTSRALRGRLEEAIRKYLELKEERRVRLKQPWVNEAFSVFSVQPQDKTLDDLTLSESIQLLLHHNRKHYCSRVFGLEVKALGRMLEQVRITRNKLAHFRGEVSVTQRKQLRFCVDWFAKHPASIPAGLAGAHIRESEQTRAIAEPRSSYVVSNSSTDDFIPTEESPASGESRYTSLAIWLQEQSPGQERVQTTFSDIEHIIGTNLPASAWRHRAWWANDNTHTHARLWLEAGWRVSQINMTEERVTFARIREREKSYIDFFGALQKDMQKHNPFPIKESSPAGYHWLPIAALPQDDAKCLHFVFSFARGSRFRTELYINSSSQETNKSVFDRLYANRDQFKADLDENIAWERLDGKQSSRIALYHPGSITDGETELVQLREWAVDAMKRFYQSFAVPAERALLKVVQSRG